MVKPSMSNCLALIKGRLNQKGQEFWKGGVGWIPLKGSSVGKKRDAKAMTTPLVRHKKGWVRGKWRARERERGREACWQHRSNMNICIRKERESERAQKREIQKKSTEGRRKKITVCKNALYTSSPETSTHVSVYVYYLSVCVKGNECTH